MNRYPKDSLTKSQSEKNLLDTENRFSAKQKYCIFKYSL